MQNNFSKCREWVPRGTSQHKWRWLTTLLLILTLGIGQMWANQTELITGITLPDIPTTSLDMASQTTFTADANGWIVFDAWTQAANLSTIPTWWTQVAKQSQTADAFTASDLTSTAPFVDRANSAAFNPSTGKGKSVAIRFKGAEKASFLVHPRSANASKRIFAVIFSYSGTTQTKVAERNTTADAFTELLFNDLSSTTEYIAYIYDEASQNACICEIAIKKPVSTTPSEPAITSPAGDPDLQTITQGETKQFTVTATGYPAPTFKWYKNSSKSTTGATEIEGATAASYTTLNTLAASADNYYFYCVATNENGTAQSPYFSLKVNELGEDLTVHTPGVYEKATDQGGWGKTMVTYEVDEVDRQFEIIGVSSASSKDYWWAGTTTTNTTDAHCLSTEGFAASGFTKTQVKGEWMKGNSIRGGSGPSNGLEEFPGSSSYYTVRHLTSTDVTTIKVQGYDQISLYAKDNNATESNKKYFVVKINGVTQPQHTLSTSFSIRRYTLDPSIVSVIQISGNTASANNDLSAFSLRLPACTKPGTPTSLAAGSVTHSSASLSWAAGENSDGHKIYIEKKSDKTKVLDWTDATSPYAASDLDPETEYTFKVKAKGVSGYCDLGDEASADFETETAPIVNYTVTIDPNGGTYESTPDGWTLSAGVYTKSVTGGSFTPPTGLTKGTDELSWKDNHGTAITFPITLAKDSTFVAQWAELYTITTGSPANGTVDADKESAIEGATITLTASPNIGYKLKAWDVYKTGDATTKVSVSNNQFTMPAYGVTINAEFIEATVLYDYSVMANKSFTDETVSANANNKDHTFGSEGNPQLIISKAGWDDKGNIINSFIKFFGGTSGMSVVIPAGRKATVTIKYGSYNTGKYLLVNGTEQTHPKKALDNSITTSNIDTYMPTVELTNQTGTLTLTANASGNNIYIAYVDVALTGYASYGITYHLNDGAWDGDAGAATYTYGTGIATLASNVAKEGCDFAGWYGNEGLTGDEITSIANNVTGDKELWAKWTPKSYTLTWDWNGGSCSATEGDDYTAHGSVAYGTTLVYPETSTVTKAGTAFAGWSSSPATMPAGDLTITAQWAPSHDITYKETKGASNSNPATYVEGVGVASFEPLEDVTNFHFNGWSPASIGTDATEDVDVTAQWVDAFNVTFSAGEGSGTVPATFQKWATATFNLPGQGDLVAPAGKVFAGWKANGAGETRAAGYEYTMTAAAVEFVAQWKVVTLLINFDGENYSLNTDKFVIYDGTELQGENYTVQTIAFEKNFKFGNTGSSISGQTWANKYMAYDVRTNSTDIKLYLYNKNSSNQNLYYQVIYEGAAAGSLQTVSVTSKNAGQILEIPTIEATKGARVVFCAQSTDIRICQVEVFENGTALPAFGTNGYEFSIPGRAATYSKTGTFDGFSFKTYNDIKFISGIEYMSLRANNGNEYVRFTIDDNIQLKVTETNAKEFYVCTSTTGGTVDDTKYGGTNGTHNINLHAGTYNIVPVVSGSSGELKITKLAFATAPDIVTVTFNSNEGSAVAEQELFAGEKAVTPTAPTREGYRFVEWQLSGSTYDFDDAVAANITLDAVWQKIWTVTFNSNGGSDVAAATVDNGQAVAQPANPTRAGFDFVEWQLNSVVYDFATPVTANITLVATWEVAQDDATLSALSYNGNAIDVNSAVEVAGVKTYTVHLQWGSTINDALISVTKNAESASLSAITYDGENKKATFSVESGNHLVVVNYAIQFVIDAKRGTSIIKATTNNVVTGLIGGARDTNLGDGNTKKLNKGNYFGVTLANDETFQEGDVFIVNITTPADLGKFMIYADKNRTELIADQGIVYTKPDVASPVVCPTGEMMLVLPAAANGKKSLYLSRENVDNSEQWNVTFSYIEVTREMNPAIKSFKFGENAATINEAAKTITYEVAYGTAVTALTPTVEAYGNNGATYTPAGATDFTSPVVYTVTDAYNELHTDYTVTVNIAAPSENANLASLAVEGYSLDFDPATTSYNVVLDYGTTVLPTITYEVAEVGIATANKAEGGVNGATTITVTPQAGAGYEKVYTINFSVNTTPTFKVFDGRTMNAAIVSFTDPTSGMTWTSEDASTSSSSNTKTINGKTYTKSVKIFGSATNASRYLKFTVPADYVAKFYLAGSTNSSTGEATLFFSKELTADPAKAIAGLTASVDDPKWAQTDYQLPGDYYFCVTGSARIYELSVTLYPIDEERTMTQGRFGTICYPNGGRLLGAMLLEIAYFDPDQKKIFFDEVVDGQMVAGAPYLFLPNEGVDKFAIKYTDNVSAPAGHHNGLYGSYTQEALPTDGNHYIMLNNQYCKVVEANTYVGANRAYIKLDKIGNDYVAPSYGRRRVSMDVQGEQVATGMEGLNVGDQPIKLMINGQMYILRGDKMYDATGRLVK